MSTAVDYEEVEKQLAKEAIKYLTEHGIWLEWHYHEDTPPTKEVREFLLEIDFFDLDNAECIVTEDAIEQIEFEWSLDEEENG